MISQEEDNALNMDSFIFDDSDISDSEMSVAAPSYFIDGKEITFGFFEKSEETFYKIIDINKSYFKLSSPRTLEISYIKDNKEYKLYYQILNNFPTFFYIENQPKDSLNILIHFSYPPKFTSEEIKGKIKESSSIYGRERTTERLSEYFLDNFNKNDNLNIFDNPFKNVLIHNLNDHNIFELKRALLLIINKEINLKSLNILTKEIYFERVKKLKDHIEYISNNDFYCKYINYANISETIQKEKCESILSIYKNFSSNFKIKKYDSYTKKDKNNNSFYIMKHVSISPNIIKIKKESFHQSSRFLRLYFKNDNFIKLEFKDDKDTQLYTNFQLKNDDINLKYGLSYIYDLIFKNGLNLCGKKYLFFLNPTNCLRANCLWLLEENEFKEKSNFYYNDLGLDSLLQKEGIHFSKLLARLSQNFTSTNEFENKLLINENIQNNLLKDQNNDKNIFIFKKDNNDFNKKLLFSSRIINDLVTNDNKIYNDGCGIISYELMKDICRKLNKGIFASAIQVRYKGAKGVLVVSDKIKGRIIFLTKSMVKFECNNTEDLEVIRFSKYSCGYLNLQILILLILNGVDKNKIFSIAKKEVCNFRNFKNYNSDFFLKNSKNIFISNNKNNIKNNDKIVIKDKELELILNDIQKQDKLLKIHKDYLTKIARSTYIYNRLSNISKKYRFHLKNCCFMIGVIDFDNILKEDEVFVQVCKEDINVNKDLRDNNLEINKKIILGDILVTKNPCLSVYDLQKVKGIYNEYFAKFFYNVIIFPAKGKIPLPSKITGSDLDGDIYWVCWEQSFIRKMQMRNYDYKPNLLVNNEQLPTKIEDKYISLENGEKIKKVFLKVQTKDFQTLCEDKFRDKMKNNITYNKLGTESTDDKKTITSIKSSELFKDENKENININDLNNDYIIKSNYKSNINEKNNSLSINNVIMNLNNNIVNNDNSKDYNEMTPVKKIKNPEITTLNQDFKANFVDYCLAFHKYFHNNYKLPDVNKDYLSYINTAFANNASNPIYDIYKLEEFAFYHSLEVDFQKAGVTSDFKSVLMQPSFLMKRIQRNCSNCIIKIKEIYDQYQKGLRRKYESCLCEKCFYDYFIKFCKEQNDNIFNKRNLKLFEKKNLTKEINKNSYIYKLYSLVSFFSPMQDAFLNSLFLASDEFFYASNLQIKIFEFSLNFYCNILIQKNDINQIDTKNFIKILDEVCQINNYYENEIKYIMWENEISIEAELIFLTEFIEPKIAIFKNDIEDYKLNLNEQISYASLNAVKKLNDLKMKYNLNKSDIENLLFISLFWIMGKDVIICIKDKNIKSEYSEYDKISVNVDKIIKNQKRINNVKGFIENMVSQKQLDGMRAYFYENLKCISLYNHYLIKDS